MRTARLTGWPERHRIPATLRDARLEPSARLAGDGVHRLLASVRVYYEDTDAAGIVYHANYLKFAERGRTEMLRGLGFAHSSSAREDGGIGFTVRRCTVDYRAPARLDDALTVETRVAEIGAATLSLRPARSAAATRSSPRSTSLVACIGRDGPAAPPPAGPARRARRRPPSVSPHRIVQKTP